MPTVHSKKFNQQVKKKKIQPADETHRKPHPQTFLTQETEH